jgi:hypothetical protein
MPCRPVARGCGLGGNSSYTSQLRLGVAVTVVRSAGPRLAQAAGVIWSAISRARDAHRLGRPGTWAAQVCPGPSALSAAQTRSRVAAPWSCRVRRSHRGALAIIATCPQRRGPAGGHLARCHWQAAGSDLARSGAAVARPGPEDPPGPDWRTGICFGSRSFFIDPRVSPPRAMNPHRGGLIESPDKARLNQRPPVS